MKKRKIILFAVLMGILVACAPTEEEVSGTDDNGVIEQLKTAPLSEVPDKLELKVSDDIAINAEINIPGTLNVYELNDLYATNRIFTEEEKEAYCVLLLNLSGMSGDIEEIDVGPMANGQDDIQYSVNVSMFESVGVNNTSIDMFTNESAKLYAISSEMGYETNGMRFYYETEKELDFESIESAKEHILSYLEQFDLEFTDQYVCYSMDVSTMNEVADFYMAEYDAYFIETQEPCGYTKQDEAYCFELLLGHDNIPYYDYKKYDKEVANMESGIGSVCRVYYNKNGIIGIIISDSYDVTEEGEQQELVTIGDVLEAHLEQMEVEKTIGPIEVTDISLSYLPSFEDEATLRYHMIPVWTVAYTQEVEITGDTNHTQLERKLTVYDAVTGEKLW